MKRKLAVLLLFLMMIQLPMSVSATETAVDKGSVSPISAYCMEDTLYSFVQIEGYDAAKMVARTGLVGGETAAPTAITETGSGVTYILLIDNSGSMKKYGTEITTFAETLVEQEKQDVEFIIITFGEQVLFNESVNTVNCLDRAAVKNVVLDRINSLDYSEDWTNTYTGITSVMDYLDKNYPGKQGDLVNLILITDGEPDLEDKSVEESEAEAAMQRVAETPEVVLHTVSFQQWNPEHAMPNGTGIDVVVGEDTDAVTAAKSVTDFVDGIYRIDFIGLYSGRPMADRSSVSYYLSNVGEETTTAIELLPVSIDSVPVMTVSGGQETGQVEAEPDAGNKEAEESPIVPDNGEKEAEVSPLVPETSEDVTIIFEEETETEEVSATQGSFQNGIIIGAVCCAIIIVIILAAIKVLSGLRRRKKEKPAEGAILVRFDVISGKCASKERNYYLSDQLLIGSGSHCDLILSEPEVSSQNTRIFVKDQIVYIEDLGSRNGTVLGGMRLHGVNRLRSGDDVSIGSVCFRVLF